MADMERDARRAVRRIQDHQEIVKQYQKVVRAYSNFMRDYPWINNRRPNAREMPVSRYVEG